MFALSNELLVAAARAGLLDPGHPVPFRVDPTQPGPRTWHTGGACVPGLVAAVAVRAGDLADGRDVFTDPGAAGWLVCTACDPALLGFEELTVAGTGETLAWLAAADRVFRDPVGQPADTAGAAAFLLTVADLLAVPDAARAAVAAAGEGLADRLAGALAAGAAADAARALVGAGVEVGAVPAPDAGSAPEASDRVWRRLAADRVWAAVSLVCALGSGISYPAHLGGAGFHGEIALDGRDRYVLVTLPRAAATWWARQVPGAVLPLAEATWSASLLRAACALLPPATGLGAGPDGADLPGADLPGALAPLLAAVAAAETPAAGATSDPAAQRSRTVAG